MTYVHRPENELIDKGIKCCYNWENRINCTVKDNMGSCFNNGSECDYTCNNKLYVDYSTAKLTCESNGYRLCSLNELQNLCNGLGIYIYNNYSICTLTTQYIYICIYRMFIRCSFYMVINRMYTNIYN